MSYKPETLLVSDVSVEFNSFRMCNDLRIQGVLLGRGTGELLDLIYAHRSSVIHEAIRIPVKDEAQGIALFTNDVMNRIFAYFNTQLQSPLSRMAS